jgi:tRNA G10  N-methylase Trm11
LPEVIPSGRTPGREEAISEHPCLKPQYLMRIIVRSLLPLDEGVVPDPFMGSGSTITAAEAVGYRSVGIEVDKDCFRGAEVAIPKLADLYPTFEGGRIEFDASDYPQEAVEESQLTIALPPYVVSTASCHMTQLQFTSSDRLSSRSLSSSELYDHVLSEL